MISESLYELYKPDSEPWVVDIIFFHGLQPMSYADAYWKTWSSGGNQLWPRTWLGEDFPQARILSVSYDSCAVESARGGVLDMTLIGENLDFRKLRKRCGFPTNAVAESHRIQFWFFSVLVVEEASARLDVDQGRFYTAPNDHINICKPKDKLESTYKLLRNFITDSVKQKMDLDLAPRQDLT